MLWFDVVFRKLEKMFSFFDSFAFLFKSKNRMKILSSTVKLGNKEQFERNKLVLRNHFLWPICHLLHKDKELLALRSNFRATKKCQFLLYMGNTFCFVYICNSIKRHHRIFQENKDKNQCFERKCVVLVAAWLYPT